MTVPEPTARAPAAVGERASGLTVAEAARRLATDGPNTFPASRGRLVWRALAAQLVHFFALMLWTAGALAFVAGLPEVGIAIFVVIVLNALFAFAQEHRAERAAARLRDLVPRRARVRRDGRSVQIDASELVVGDLVLLQGGDRVSADLTAVVTHSLLVDTSLLTGESAPAAVGPADALWAGTFVVEGEAEAQVTATGRATRLAGIARLTQGRRAPGPLDRELGRVVRTIAVIAVGVGVAFFGLALLLGIDATKGFLFAIGVTVALVPEGLLPTVTLSLAIGAQRMAERHALVRRLEAVETLGSTTFICTDKTGTLTRNQMAVVRVWTPAGSAEVRGTGYEPEGELVTSDPAVVPSVCALARAAARCSNGHAARRDGRWVAEGDPMEAALDVLARRLRIDLDADRVLALESRRFPFDARRRRMAVVVGGRLFVKGAPDAVLPRCLLPPGARLAVHSMAELGLRVLAVAQRTLADGDDLESDDADTAERDLELLGLVGVEDPPRIEARDAITACRRAGIRIAMITGDHPETARAIAREVGLLLPGSPVVMGRDLPADDEVLGALLDHDGSVVSRVTPEDKLRIARALHGRGHVVAMTGDGVNDGPALHEADIGIAMGASGTDVAREAADLVLLDDDFSTIVAAVEHGRATFANIRRFLTYHLTDNVAELTPFMVWALSGGRFPLALGVLQVLALDIGTDVLPALALGAVPPGEGLLDRPPSAGRLLDASVLRRVFAVLGPAEALVEMAAFVATFLAAGWTPGARFPHGTTLLAASGAAFTAVVLGQAVNAFACRSSVRPVTALDWTGSRLLAAAVLIELGTLAAFLFVAPVADLLHHAVPSWTGFGVALLAVPAVLAADTLHKALRARSRRRTREPTS